MLDNTRYESIFVSGFRSKILKGVRVDRLLAVRCHKLKGTLNPIEPALTSCMLVSRLFSFAALISLFYAYSAMRLRKVKVAYYLIEELKIVVWAPALYLFRLVLIVAWDGIPDYVRALLLFGVAQIVFLGTLDYPLWKSYSSGYSKVGEDDSTALRNDEEIDLEVIEARSRRYCISTTVLSTRIL